MQHTRVDFGSTRIKERTYFAQLIRRELLPALRHNGVVRDPLLFPIVEALRAQAKVREAAVKEEKEQHRQALFHIWARAFAALITARRLAVREWKRTIGDERAQNGFELDEDDVDYPLTNLSVNLQTSRTSPNLDVSFYDPTKDEIVTVAMLYDASEREFKSLRPHERRLILVPKNDVKARHSLSFAAGFALAMNWRRYSLKTRRQMIPIMFDLEPAPKRANPAHVADEDDYADMPPLKRARVDDIVIIEDDKMDI